MNIGLANCGINTLSISVPFYMATTGVAIAERNELLHTMLHQLCTTSLARLHICIDIGVESVTKVRALLRSVN